ncbi:forkhead box protein M1 isoform X2 [Coregonus clupeaformis]|uniref:forkhead box protein M1 isoform X2 n=1 Tax=Coregonus clupeaformis TaxID=59861 RepID=UPI001E1C5908|nr:forkhead box protein M1 isoform X2 [Coregonus clupeaformis]
MRQSPRRPLILKRRKLPFQGNEPALDGSIDEPDGLRHKEASTSKPSVGQCFPDGIRIMDHPTMPGTQVVVIPKTADLQSVIGALTAKGKECGSQGPNKFILLSGGGCIKDGADSFCQSTYMGGRSSGRSSIALVTEKATTMDCLQDTKTLTTIKPLNRDLDCSPLDDSLTNIQWLGRMNTDSLGPDPAKKAANKENHDACQQILQAQSERMEAHRVVKDPLSERPPYSYMAMIQFAINSKKSRRMTLKEIYTWIEDHFPYFRKVAKPGWKNSIRHNLSLHDMFIRETTQDGKVSYWTIRPEANRCLTLDQVYKTESDPTSISPRTMQVYDQHQQKRIAPEIKKTSGGAPERKMKPLLPRADSYLVPIQLPFTQSLFLSSSTQLPLSALQQKSSSSGGGKRVRIAPKVTYSDASTVMLYAPPIEEMKEEQVCVPLTPVTPRAVLTNARREASSSRRKQRLVLPSNEEPVLLFPDSTFFDSGLASDGSAFQDAELDPRPEHNSPCREYSFKTPIKSSHPASSTPSKPPTVLLEPWRVTPLGKERGGMLDFSPIRTPGPSFTPHHHDHTPFSFSSTPFKDLPLFNSPRKLLTSARSSSAAGPTDTYSPGPERLQGCSRELQIGGPSTANRSLTEGLVLDTMNDSLSKILVDISFSGLEDDDLGMGNISWSQLIPELK